MATFLGLIMLIFNGLYLEIYSIVNVQEEWQKSGQQKGARKILCNKLTETKKKLGYITMPNKTFPGISIYSRKM
jgi:hypothetical protein